ncbi:GNAT family N-acetyltransferase [Halpernia frigidisoli]|uniref:Protein N-acetyltransferase, RimJ/RimL family n=1 Tax=Halpernia frigidisoli TaxID=1125876 RepID=A0A1I3H3V3_9FLAO|nr:GNAT family N-acetyltransferase [Halpernia frigidisoli]SFI30366.1 Protein N-acetyltransferase, RimJ/RimL family [Halpernia frigidisoli]
MILKELETERLHLKIAELTDAEFFLKLYNEPLFIKNIGDRNLKTSQDVENYIKEKFQPQFEKLGFGNYVMIRKSDNVKVGAVGIFVREGFDIPDIGFSVLKEFHNFGYAFEAANALKDNVFEKFNFKKLSAITTEDNISSQKLIEKLGLKYIKMIDFPGDEEMLRYYEI